MPQEGFSLGRRIGTLAGLICLCLLVAGLAGLVTVPEVRGWYQTIQKPAFTPPDGIFAPVWTLLYLMMAVAAWRAWRCDGFAWGSRALWLFLVQLTLNFTWSFLFFGAHLLGGAAWEILVLWLAILATAYSFRRRDPLAGFLMVPYLLWVGFAMLLTWTIWCLNAG